MARGNRSNSGRWTLWGDDSSIEALDEDRRIERGRSEARQVRTETVRARLYATGARVTAAT